MPTPKSKSKLKFEKKSDVMPPVPVNVSPKEWKPEPDMGSIKPPTPSAQPCGGCTHKKETHYGRLQDWCNVGGCECLEFK